MQVLQENGLYSAGAAQPGASVVPLSADAAFHNSSRMPTRQAEKHAPAKQPASAVSSNMQTTDSTSGRTQARARPAPTVPRAPQLLTSMLHTVRSGGPITTHHNCDHTSHSHSAPLATNASSEKHSTARRVQQEQWWRNAAACEDGLGHGFTVPPIRTCSKVCIPVFPFRTAHVYALHCCRARRSVQFST